MVVHAKISLNKDVEDLDKADDWFEEVKEILDGQTTCQMHASSSNRENPLNIEKAQ